MPYTGNPDNDVTKKNKQESKQQALYHAQGYRLNFARAKPKQFFALASLPSKKVS